MAHALVMVRLHLFKPIAQRQELSCEPVHVEPHEWPEAINLDLGGKGTVQTRGLLQSRTHGSVRAHTCYALTAFVAWSRRNSDYQRLSTFNVHSTTHPNVL